MSRHLILRWAPEDGPITESGLRKKLQAMGYSVSRYVYAPGTSFPEHTHTHDKIDAVVSGVFRVVLAGNEVILRSGDAVVVPGGTLHSADVLGHESVVSLDGSRS